MLSLCFLAYGEFCFTFFRAVVDLDHIGFCVPGPAIADTSRRRRRVGIREELGHRSNRGLGDGGVEWIAENELDVSFVSGKAQLLGLFRGYEQVNDLHLVGFTFRIFGNVSAGGEDGDVLEEGLGEGALGGVGGTWRVTGDEDIDFHSRGNETGNTDDLIDSYGSSSHSVGDGGGEAAAGTGSREASVEDWFSGKQLGEDAAAYRVFRVGDDAVGERPLECYGGEVTGLEDSADLDISGGGDYAGALCCSRSADVMGDDAVDCKAAHGGNSEGTQEDGE